MVTSMGIGELWRDVVSNKMPPNRRPCPEASSNESATFDAVAKSMHGSLVSEVSKCQVIFALLIPEIHGSQEYVVKLNARHQDLLARFLGVRGFTPTEGELSDSMRSLAARTRASVSRPSLAWGRHGRSW